MITFKWSEYSPRLYCQAAYYKVTASRDCGSCPTTTMHTNTTCTDVPIDGSTCIFGIQTVVCNITEELSLPLLVQVDTTVVSKESNVVIF
jgi:hypothetical protein